MNITIDFSLSSSKKPSLTSGITLAESSQKARPGMIVIQPNGSLDKASSSEFQKVLEQSLEQAIDGVIVDLLWVDSIDSYGISALVACIQQALELGKLLSFQSMTVQTRTPLEAEWTRQREIIFGPRSDLFEKDLERFLDKLAKS